MHDSESGSSASHPAAVWFRRDLRLHDHAPLRAAAASGRPVVCVYCLDPRDFASTRERGFPRFGPFRARFLIDAIEDLRTSLREIGGDLIVVRGTPDDVLPAMAREQGWASLHFHRLVGTEELEVERGVARAFRDAECNIDTTWDRTLVDPKTLPFGLDDLPEVFSSFRRAAERHARFSRPSPAPGSLAPAPAGVDPGELPTVAELGVEEPTIDARAALPFPGGETAGRSRLQHYFWDADRLRVYEETRNEMLGADYSSKFAPWLAHGCLSPRWVQQEVERYEDDRVRNKSTGWLTFELLWRDYFQLITAKHGANLFRPSGLQGLPVPWQHDEVAFEAWRTGQTGYPLVDANMRELLATGFMSNRGRQIVASFLTKNLGIDWRWGAEWFESQLIDHDVAANYGNWNYVAGVGNDAREFRYFNIPTQASKYDRRGEYVKLWCPELDLLGRATVHQPWTLSPMEQQMAGLVLGKDYPKPIVDLDESVRRVKRAWEAATGC